MKFMLLIAGDESQMNAATVVDESGMSAEYAAYNEAMIKAGVLLSGERLRPTSQTRKVRVRDKKAVVINGPYADVQEQLGGFYILETPTIEDAVEWAGKCPAAQYGSIEVRPIWPTGRE